MDTRDHATKSFERIYAQDPQFFLAEWLTLRQLIFELHAWFDTFKNTKDYNTAYNIYYHREVRHHWGGDQRGKSHLQRPVRPKI
jgi:hypothetical protein